MANIRIKTETDFNDNNIDIVNKYNSYFLRYLQLNDKDNVSLFNAEIDSISNYYENIIDLIITNRFKDNKNTNDNITIYYCDRQKGLIKQIATFLKKQINNSRVLHKDYEVFVSNSNTFFKDVNTSEIIIEYNINKNHINWLFNDAVLNVLLNEIDNVFGLYIPNLYPNINNIIDLGTTAKECFSNDINDNVEKFASLIKKYQRGSNILTSVSLGQFILESYYGQSNLVKEANNCFGMKLNLSGRIWPSPFGNSNDSFTQESYNSERIHKTIGVFRKYPNIENSIIDHCCYLLYAKNEKKFRYYGINKTKSIEEASKIIQNGVYCTDDCYADMLIDIINKNNLTKYDD